MTFLLSMVLLTTQQSYRLHRSFMDFLLMNLYKCPKESNLTRETRVVYHRNFKTLKKDIKVSIRKWTKKLCTGIEKNQYYQNHHLI